MGRKKSFINGKFAIPAPVRHTAISGGFKEFFKKSDYPLLILLLWLFLESLDMAQAVYPCVSVQIMSYLLFGEPIWEHLRTVIV